MTKPKGGKRPKGMTSHKLTHPDPRKPKGLKPGKTLLSQLRAAADLHPDLVDYMGVDNPLTQGQDMDTVIESSLFVKHGQGKFPAS